MKRILIYGLKDPVGGVERIVLDYVKSMVRNHGDIAFDFLLYGEGFSLEREIEALGCRVLYLPSRRRDYMGYKKALRRIFDDNEYFAVWGNYSGLTNIDLLVMAKRHDVPVRIAHSHLNYVWWGSPIMKYPVWALHYWNKLRVPRYATHYWACSRLAGEFMFPEKTHDRLQVINNAIDVTRFCPDEAEAATVRHQLGIVEDAVVVGHVARMCTQKNQIFMLQVMAEILKLAPDAVLLFVGDGELRQEIEAEVQRLGIGRSVVFTGERSDVPRLVRAMDVFLLPSLVEGFGICILEAQACGVPCVVSDTVPRTTNVTGAVEYVSLENSPALWAGKVLAQAGSRIKDPVPMVTAGGFEIDNEAERLYRMLSAQ